jgi:hypothetical protein
MRGARDDGRRAARAPVGEREARGDPPAAVRATGGQSDAARAKGDHASAHAFVVGERSAEAGAHADEARVRGSGQRGDRGDGDLHQPGEQHAGEDDLRLHGVFAFGGDREVYVAVARGGGEDLEDDALAHDLRSERHLDQRFALPHLRVGGARSRARAAQRRRAARLQPELARREPELGRVANLDAGDRHQRVGRVDLHGERHRRGLPEHERPKRGVDGRRWPLRAFAGPRGERRAPPRARGERRYCRSADRSLHMVIV